MSVADDDLLRIRFSLVARFQRDVHAPVVQGASAAADRHGDARDIGIGEDDRTELFLNALHLSEGHILTGFGDGGEEAGILLRKEPFGNNYKQVSGQRDGGEEDAQGGEPPTHHQVQSASIGTKKCIETALAELIDAPVLSFLGMRLEET